jgi:hypothetical protein
MAFRRASHFILFSHLNSPTSQMSFDEAVKPRYSSRYAGEDTSATTTRELNGWYSYAIAAEVYAVVGVGKHA